MNSMRKGILIAVSVIVTVFLLCILQYAIHYYSNPLRKDISFSTTGCLIFNLEEGDYELVPVEIKGENLHYIYHNREDALQGDIFVNGYSIFGHERDHDAVGLGFFSEFHESDYTCVSIVSISDDERLCKIIALSKDWHMIVCGVEVDSNISQRVEAGKNRQALLVISADNLETAQNVIEEISSHSEQMKEWLIKYKKI